MTRLAAVLFSLVLGGAASSCKESRPGRAAVRDGRLGAQRCSGQPGADNKRLPVLQRPFDNQYPVYSLFDHDLPRPDVEVLKVSDRELTYCGLNLLGLSEGYSGYAFGLPARTPVLSSADGEVIAAGEQPPFPCPITKRRVTDQLSVDVLHTTLGEVGFMTRYVHLDKVVVKKGDRVVAGQRLGLSGQSGCASEPLLYFEVRRLTGTKSGEAVVVDPYGWDGPGVDPWTQSQHGAESLYLWKDGEAPTLRGR